MQLRQEKRQLLCLSQEDLNYNVRNPIHTPPFIIAMNKPLGKELFVLINKTKIMSILNYSDIFIILQRRDMREIYSRTNSKKIIHLNTVFF